MRLRAPRIPPIADEAFDDQHRAAWGRFATGEKVPNLFKTVSRAPEAVPGFQAWGGYVLSRGNSLPPREREMVILRVGYLCRSGYEFAQHERIGLRAGLTDDEITRIKLGADAGWSGADKALIRACDDLVADHFISDAVWTNLLEHFSQRQAMDVVFTACAYVQVSTVLNAFGVQPEPGLIIAPELAYDQS